MSDQMNPVTEEELHAYVDGALPESRRADVERELARRPESAARVSDYFSLNHLLHDRYDRILSEPVPAQLRSAPEARRKREAANWPRFAGMAAALVMGIGIGWGVHFGTDAMTASTNGSDIHAVSADSSELFARQAAFAHVVYMPEIARPDNMSRRSQEQDFVQWLSNRLGTNVHPPMLEQSGFRLAGGRLLPGDGGTQIAQFMYHNAQGERITLCISHRKVSSNTTAFKLYQDGPVNVFYWVDGDFGYALSGGIDRDVLLRVSHDVYAQLNARKVN
ncbi:anti-sigma factor [Paraburkholderia sp.]|uniref:anti-sigma factor family protein n=1 Tax=Paraburkholderia sp. TaxID=1926495 RepID=UPI0025F230F9|nr:anti-sigma factor [Paraburkholderia sp.]